MKTQLTMRWTSGCLALLLMAGASAARADVCSSIAGNVVTNCGFETGDFSGWMVGGNLQSGFYGVDGSMPNSGSYGAFFGTPGGNGNGTLGPFAELSQKLSLLPGEYYRVSFYYEQTGAVGNGYLNYLDFRFGGVQRASWFNLPITTSWYVPASFVVTTSGDAVAAANTILQFDFQNDSSYWNLDDVSVAAIGPVPEPASMGLLSAAGLLGLVVRRRRK